MVLNYGKKEVEELILKFDEWGKSLGTRKLGRILRKEVGNLIENSNEKVILDFRGVKTVSNSFADECFGKLVLDYGIDDLKEKTTFKNVSKEIDFNLKKAIHNRILEVEH
ncbi:MAG: hypothetical protein AWU54_1469 [Candidatus Frackibacter sp. T328-2]|nr:MAG: hypothetical protein AWU54_1469 [Candidatus Frackibacter sp. T328-2]